MKKQMKIYQVLFFIAVLTSVGCDKCKDTDPPIEERDYSLGHWIINEGAFNGNNASIDVKLPDNSIVRDVFQTVNGFPLGDVLQRAVVSNGIAYAVLNNSNKVVIFNAKTFAYIREITGLDYPRDVAVVNGKIFIAQGATQGKVAQYSNTGQWINEVAVGNGPERLLFAHDRLWVLNSGGWLTDNTVQTIDISTMTVDHTWTVGDRPVDIEYESTEGAVFVLSSGETLYDANWNIIGHTDAALSKFIGLNDPITVQIGAIGDHPRSMTITSNDNIIWVANPKISAFQSNLNALCTECISGDYYSVDAEENGNVFITSVPDFTSSSTITECRATNYLPVRTFEGGLGTSAVIMP